MAGCASYFRLLPLQWEEGVGSYDFFRQPRRSRQFDARRFGVAPKERSDMANPLDQRRLGRHANLRNHGLARFTILGVDPDFDQFMMIERQQDFVQDRRRDAVVADDYDRLAVMGQGLEMTLLWIGEREHESTRDG